MHLKTSNQNIYRAPEDYEREAAEKRYAQQGANARIEMYRTLHPFWRLSPGMTPRQIHHAGQSANLQAAVAEQARAWGQGTDRHPQATPSQCHPPTADARRADDSDPGASEL